MAGQCVFNNIWMEMEDYKEWLQCHPTDRHQAKCRLCNKNFSISKMGESALKSHLKGAKHSSLLKFSRSVDNSSFLKPKAISSVRKSNLQTNSLEAINEKQKIIVQGFVQKTETLDAEILWAFKTVKSHYSYKSNEDISSLFKKIFPDSAIAGTFTCGERKTAYYVVFGIAPYLKSNLIDEVIKNTNFVLLFDESLNEMRQMKQLDIHVRFWNENLVQTAFLTSAFLGHATAQDLFENLHSAILSLKISNILQVSMDGPNVNWKLYEMLQSECKTQFGKLLINTGSCSLHIIHNAFKYGFQSSGWEISSFFLNLFHLFKDSPARKDDYLQLEGTIFPLKFVANRWLENVIVCERALEILSSITAYIDHVEKRKVKEPACNAYSVVKKNINDTMIRVKLYVLLSIAKVSLPFQCHYQTDRPMMPFLTEDMRKMLWSLMNRFIKPEILEKITAFDLINVDVTKTDNHCKLENINLGFDAEQKIKELYLSKKVTDKDMLCFRMEVKSILVKLTSKLLLKCPIKYSIVRHMACLDPSQMINNKAGCIKKMKLLLAKLCEADEVKSSDCDEIISDFSDFVNTTVAENCSEFLEFNNNKSRLDTLLVKFMKPKFFKLWVVVQKLLLLSHGQASVERGFSVNRKIEVETMKEESYSAQRLICDYLSSLNGDVSKVTITKELRSSVSAARQRYYNYLEEERKKGNYVKKSRKRKLDQEEEEEFIKKKMILEKSIKHLLKSADEFAEEAERNNELSLISQSNSLRRTAKLKQEELACLEKSFSEKQTK